ncbi:MAG TPA: zinc ribbon domain-containing protein [Candidatus Anoxymicrobiaceae bacterium]
MRCPNCGQENASDKKFCTGCGKPLGEETVSMQQAPPPQPTTQMPAAPAQAPVYPPVQQVPHSSKRKTWIVVLACVLGVCVIAAAIAIPLLIAAANKPAAQVNSVKMTRTDGDTLDTGKVPLDTDLSISVSYKARFNDTGSGTLRVVVEDSAGENIIDKSYDVKSSGQAQTKLQTFSMTQGSGKPMHAKATLTVKQGATKIGSVKSLAFTAVKGKGASLQFEEALAAATKKCQEATDTLKSVSASGVNVTDLVDRLSKALTDLKNAKTAEEANAVTETAQSVVDESNARKTAQDEKSRTATICKQNQAVVKARLADWWGGTGNFPNSLSELSNLPVCPDGGTYTYFAPDTTPATLHVSCSVHGEL